MIKIRLNEEASLFILVLLFLMPLFLLVMSIAFAFCSLWFWWFPVVIMVLWIVIFGYLFYWFDSKIGIYEDYFEIINMKKTIKIFFEEIECIKIVKNLGQLNSHQRYIIVLKNKSLSIKFRIIDNRLFNVEMVKSKINIVSIYQL